MAPISVVHVINGGEGVGGAERMLCRILHAADRRRFQHTVVTILECIHLKAETLAAGARFISLDLGIAALAPRRLLPAVPRLLSVPRADLFVGWLNYGGVLASILATARGNVPYILNFRSTPTASDLRRPIMRAMRVSSSRAAVRLANAYAAVARLEEAGFGEVQFIANGFSPKEFQRNVERGREFRRQHAIPLDAFLFGHVGRFTPLKNQTGLLRGAVQALAIEQGAHIVFVGRGTAAALAEHLPTGTIASRIHIVDEIERPQDAYSAFDAYVHNSDWEGFPNVVAEAMLQSLPIVCSDAGESRSIVGPNNLVVPTGRDDVLAEAMLELLRMPVQDRLALGAANRVRISELYSLDRVVAEFEQHFLEASGTK